jgi:hypothetical protein
MDKHMQAVKQSEPDELLLVISGDAEFYGRVQQELRRRRNQLCVATVRSFDGARHVIEARSPTMILLEENVLGNGSSGPNNRKAALRAAATMLAGSAPVVVSGSAEHQSELTALLAARNADYVTRSESCLPVAISLVERRLRQRLMHAGQVAGVRKEREDGPASQPETRDFGEDLAARVKQPADGNPGECGTAAGGMAEEEY